jgi:release factor glutamine methyltransferase
MATVKELLNCSRDLPGDSAQRDGEILLGHCLGKSRTWLYTWPENSVEPTQVDRFRTLLARRAQGEPVAYLVGRREFWSMNLRVDNSTLIPRPETETLVEWALELDMPEEARLADLGTGSGAIALALARERPAWDVTGVDVSASALQVAGANAREYNLERVALVQSDWFDALDGQRFDLLVANPPYLDAQDIHLTRGDVRFEPDSALVSADQGLADLANIIETAPSHLHSGGYLLLEHGFEQGAPVREMLAARGFSTITTRCDIAGQPRISGGLFDAQ